jgi:hypothetical protein
MKEPPLEGALSFGTRVKLNKHPTIQATGKLVQRVIWTQPL